jgi:hypothetical protein
VNHSPFGADPVRHNHSRTVLTDGYTCTENPEPSNSGVSDLFCQSRKSLNQFDAQTLNVVEAYLSNPKHEDEENGDGRRILPSKSCIANWTS